MVPEHQVVRGDPQAVCEQLLPVQMMLVQMVPQMMAQILVLIHLTSTTSA